MKGNPGTVAPSILWLCHPLEPQNPLLMSLSQMGDWERQRHIKHDFFLNEPLSCTNYFCLYKPEIDLMASSNCKWQLGSYCLSTLLNRRRAQMLEITSIWVHKNWCYYNDKNNFFLGEMSYLLNFTSLQLLYHHHRFLKVSKVKLQNEIELICWFISDYVKVLRTCL